MRSTAAEIRSRSVALVVTVVAVLLLGACQDGQPASGSPSASASPGGARPIVIDTDLGADDILAIAILVRDPTVEVRAITLVGTGLVHCAPGLANLAGVLYQLGVQGMPTGCGSEDPGPDGRSFPDEWRAGTDAGYGLTLGSPAVTGSEDAVELLATVLDAPGPKVTIVELGPWSNLAALFTARPDLATRVDAIHAMGGTLDVPGNVFDENGVPLDPPLEWNLAADPSAVTSVVELGLPVRLVTLDATNQVRIDPRLYERLREDHAAAGSNLAFELLTRNSILLAGGTFLWDELAALALLDPDLVAWTRTPVHIDGTGHLARAEEGTEVQVATDAAPLSALDAIVAALGVGAGRPDPFELTTRLAVTWDGSVCAADPVADPVAGFWDFTFDNLVTGSAVVAMVSLTPPHTWDELVAFLETFREQEQVPGWIVVVGFLEADDTGQSAAFASVPAGIAGPVCATQATIETDGFTPGEPITVVP